MFSRKLALVAAPVLALASLPSMAAVPAGVEAIFTTAATDFGTLLGYGYTAAAVIVTGMIVLGLSLKVAKRSTKG